MPCVGACFWTFGDLIPTFYTVLPFLLIEKHYVYRSVECVIFYPVLADHLGLKYNLPIKVGGSNARGFFLQLYTGSGAPNE